MNIPTREIELFQVLYPEWLHTSLWAVVSGLASMLLYARCSPQQRLKNLKDEAASIHRELAGYDGDFAGAMALTWRNLQLSIRLLSCALLPALLAGFPVLIALFSISEDYVLFFIITAATALTSKWILRIE